MALVPELRALFENSNFSNLIFLLLGFFLNLACQIVAQWRRNRRIRTASKSELKALQFQLRDKSDIISKILRELEQGKLLPANSVRGMDLVYRNYIIELQLKLTPVERNCLHYIYEWVRILDFELEQFESSYAVHSESKGHDAATKYHAARLRDLRNLCDRAGDLIEKYLLGAPPKVFEH